MNDTQQSCDHIVAQSRRADESWLTTSSRLQWDMRYLEDRFNFCPMCGADLGIVWEDLNATTPKESDQQ